MTNLKEENDLFEDAFYNWCIRHGVAVYTRVDEITSSKGRTEFMAYVDLNELKAGIFQLIQYNLEEGKYKVQAIKGIQQITGCSLTEAKEFYDRHHAFHNVESA